MAARLRAPGLTRGGAFFVVGVLFCAGLVLGIRALYGFPITHDGSLTTHTQNGILIVSLIGAPLFFLPVFAGIANFVLPLMIGAPDMAFPRLNALSYWLLPIAGLMMTGSFLAPGGSFSTGWTAYAPLSTDMPIGQMFFTIGVQFAGASSIATALNFLVTIITMRAPGMSFWRMPLL